MPLAQSPIIGVGAAEEGFGNRPHSFRHADIGDPHLAQRNIEVPEQSVGEILRDLRAGRRQKIKSAQHEGGVQRQ